MDPNLLRAAGLGVSKAKAPQPEAGDVEVQVVAPFELLDDFKINTPTHLLITTPEEDSPGRMRKLSRAMMPKWKLRQLQAQGDLCPLCGKPIDLKIPKEGVVDHDHDTGEIRGILHRSCNSGEGKVANAMGSWVVKNMSYPAIIAGLERLLHYLKTARTGYIYPTHISKEEAERKAKNKRNLQAKERRAKQKAARLLRGQQDE